MEEDVD